MSTAAEARSIELGRRFLKALHQTVKLVSLYRPNHPVPASSMQQAWNLLHELFADTGWPEAVVALAGGRWMINDHVVADTAQAYELVAAVFRQHALLSVTFRAECKLFEFSALCEMLATPPNQAYEGHAGDFLRERGVRQVEVNLEEYVRARKVTHQASLLVQSPLAGLAERARLAEATRQAAMRAAAEAAPSPGSGPGPGAGGDRAASGSGAGPGPAPQGFGSFIKNLVERTVTDPAERARIYAEAVGHVEQAPARHVSEATHRLMGEKQTVINERARAEGVLGAVARGKVLVDQEGRVLMMDPTAEELSGVTLSEAAGKDVRESLGGEESFVALSKDLVLPENRPISGEVGVAGREEVVSALQKALALVQDERGRVVGTFGILPHAAKYRELQKMQDEFVANMTHDLKAPLAAISSALQMLQERAGPALDSEQSEFLEISLRNSRTLKQMVDELLDFSKIQSGAMTVRPQSGPLLPLLKDSARALAPWAQTKKILVDVVSPSEVERLPTVMRDPARVIQILNNLVSNAIKFTPEGGRVSLAARLGQGPDQGFVVVSVKDTGCGIPVPDQKRIFERFAQAESNPAKREGVGLGLAICKDLVTRHKGRIWCESEPGKGATFSFTLPVAG